MAGSGKVANLSVGVSLDTRELSEGLTKAEVLAQRSMDRLQVKTVAIGTAVGGLLSGAISQVAQGIPALFTAVVDGIDAFNDLADATGSSVEAISSLDEVARRTGTEFGTLEGSLVKLNRQLAEAGDNEAGDAFRALGLDVQRLRALDPAEAIQEVAEALGGFADDAEKARIIQTLFGKSVKEVAPFLKDLAENGRAVATVTAEQTAAAEAYNKALAGLKADAENAARALVSELLPALTSIMSQLTDGAQAYGSFSAALLDIGLNVNPFKNLRENSVGVAEDIAKAEAALAKLRQQAAEQGPIARAIEPLDDVIADSEKYLETLKARQRYFRGQESRGVPEASYSNEGKRSTAAPSLAGALAAEEAKRKAQEAAEKAAAKAAEAGKRAAEQRASQVASYLGQLDAQIQRTQDLTESERVLADISSGRFKGNAQEQELAKAKAAQIDASKRLADQLKAEAEQWERIDSARRNQASAIKEENMSDLDRWAAKVQEVYDLEATGDLTSADVDKSISRLSTEYDALIKKAEEASGKQTEYALQAARNIQDALGNTLEEGLSGNYDNILEDWASLLQKMVSQAIAADLMAHITGKGRTDNTAQLVSGAAKFFGGLFGGGAAGSGTWQSGSYGGGVDGTHLLPGFATGTNYVPQDMDVRVHKGESIVPKKYNPAAGGAAPGGGVVINNFGADIQQEKRENGQTHLAIRNAVRNELIEDFSRGGPMSQFGRNVFGWQRQNPRRG